MEKIDIYGHKERYENWKANNSDDELTKKNRDILIQYLTDMETGNNVAKVSKKGARSYTQLNKLRQRLSWMMNQLQARGVPDITKIESKQLTRLLTDMETGVLANRSGEAYRSTDSYASVIKSFWHWWMKINRKKGAYDIEDVTEDLSTRAPERKFVYFTKEQLDQMLPYFEEDQQVILLFMFDSLIRYPTEIKSLRVKDIYEQQGDTWLNIPQEVSKTIGRTLNLAYCGEAIQKYIQRKGLKEQDRLFEFSHYYLNRKLKTVAVQIFGDRVSHPKAGGKFSEITGYDFRHSGAAHFRILAHQNPGEISIDALRQRGGWTDFEMLNYYTKLIGLDGKIDKSGLIIKQDRHKLEAELEELKKRLAVFENGKWFEQQLAKAEERLIEQGRKVIEAKQ